MGLKILTTESKNFYKILRMKKTTVAPLKAKVYGQQPRVANV